MIATGDVTGRIVPKVLDYIKVNSGWAYGGIVVQATTPPFHLPLDPVYQTLQISFSPQPWMLLLVVLPMAFLLLSRTPKAWHILQRLSERIEFVSLRGILKLGFERSQTQRTCPERPGKTRKKQGNKRGSKPRSTRGRDKTSGS